ncbi:site-2 protease family protein [Ructibacterium gallinarum]|uniref:Site-2 protease family protein n=1 Tax=Ructibacterium gallinarum TaxID=2779355 RepID=A0A9D5LZE5_9FIRM|nr:site-2 protease family protein [Ructibacterium gallinarum]MBE5039321.1 site-2 protease family protein [Ructibacterium gallinarum]
MFLSLLRDSSLSIGEKLLYILVIAFCVLLSLSIHELCHGLVAYWMGDKTAKYSGRLSLNPLHHLDPFGALCLFLFGFGWAKPVPVNPWNFNNKKGGMVLTALGGPISNFLLAFLAQVGVAVLGNIRFASEASFSFQLANVCYMICYYLVMLNLGLGIFNLIPIPPLDGSKVLNAVLPARTYFKIMEYERFGFIALIILINLPFFNHLLMMIEQVVLAGYNNIIGIFIH